MLSLALLSLASLPTEPAQSAALFQPAAQERSEPRAVQGPAERPGYLGVVLGPAEHGVGVATVQPGSPAERAGLRAGDRIVVVDGRQTLTFDAVTEAVRARGAGNEVTLVVERDFLITVEILPTEGGAPRPRLGVLLEGDTNELRVGQVEAGGPADRAGVRPGDRLLSLAGTPIPNLAALRGKAESLPVGEPARLTVARELRARLEAPPADSVLAPSAPRARGRMPGEGAEPNVDPLFVPAPPAPEPPRAPQPRVQGRMPGRPAEGAQAPETGPQPKARSAAPQARAAERERARAEARQREQARNAAPARPAQGAETRELAQAMRALRAELAELRRELGELRRELADRRGDGGRR